MVQNYGDKKVRRIFVNQRKVYSGTFDEVLEIIKDNEDRQVSGVPGQSDESKNNSDTLDMALNVINTKYRYQKWKVLLDWIKSLGFNSLHCDEPKTKELLLQQFNKRTI